VHSVIQTHDGGFGILSRDFYVWIIKTDIDGIPEFPSWSPVLVGMVALVAMMTVYRKKLKKLRG
jgi:hypothetical protein